MHINIYMHMHVYSFSGNFMQLLILLSLGMILTLEKYWYQWAHSDWQSFLLKVLCSVWTHGKTTRRGWKESYLCLIRQNPLTCIVFLRTQNLMLYCTNSSSLSYYKRILSGILIPGELNSKFISYEGKTHRQRTNDTILFQRKVFNLLKCFQWMLWI